MSESKFRAAWDQIGDIAEVKGAFGLKYKTLVEGVAAVIENLGMQPCDNTSVPRPNSDAHVLLLSGIFVAGVKVLIKSRLIENAKDKQIILQVRKHSDLSLSTVPHLMSICRLPFGPNQRILVKL